MTTMPTIPGHHITVTSGPFGRAYIECSCGSARTCATKSAANRAALSHHHEISGGCVCPPEVSGHASHPESISINHH